MKITRDYLAHLTISYVRVTMTSKISCHDLGSIVNNKNHGKISYGTIENNEVTEHILCIYFKNYYEGTQLCGAGD